MKFRYPCSLSISAFRNNQEIFSLCIQLHGNHFVIFWQIHADYAHGNSSCCTYIRFSKADTHATFCNKENFLLSVCHLDFNQFILFPKTDRLKPCFADICIFGQAGLLDNSLLGSHDQIVVAFKFLHRDHSRNLFSRLELQKIDDRRSPRCSSRLRNLICLQAICPSIIGKEHNVVMGRRRKYFFYEIFFQRLHSLDSLAAPVLAPEIINGHTLDISKMRHGDHRISDRNQVLHTDVKFIVSDLRPAVISVFIGNQKNFFPDDPQKLFLICKDRF